MPFDVSEIIAKLDEAKVAYHDLFDGKLSNGRTDQFDGAFATMRMAVEWSADEAEKENA